MPISIIARWMIKSCLTASVALFFIISILSHAALSEETTVKIGVLAKRGSEKSLATWNPTAEYLTETIPGYHFVIVPLDFDEVHPAVESNKVDFILVNSAIYVDLEAHYGVKRLLTLKNKSVLGGFTLFGGVIFTKADRHDITTLDDLVGKSFMAVNHSSFGGWIVALREIEDNNLSQSDFSRLEFGGTHDAVVHAVLNGEFDAGTVRTDTLERMSAEGLIDINRVKVIHIDHPHVHIENTEGSDFPYLHSTRLYPEWPIAQVKQTPDDLAQKVTIALLNITEDRDAARAANITGWAPPQNYQRIHECLKELTITPYEDHGAISFSAFYDQYRFWILTLLGTAIALLASLAQVLFLNRNLNITRSKLQDMNETLESRVVERTKNLHRANKEMVREIKERTRAQELCRLAKTEWERTFDSIKDDIITILDKDFRIVRANSAVSHYFGLSPEEVIGTHCYKLFRNAIAPCTDCPAFTVLQDMLPHSSEIYHNKLKKHFLVTMSPMIDESGEFSRIIHSAKDITGMKQLETQFRQAQKMEAIGTLAGGIAHDFNNILTPIIGYAELVMDEVPQESPLHLDLLEIKKASYRARDLVKQILTFSRQTEQKKQVMEFQLIVKEVLKLLRASIPKTIEIKQSIPAEPLKVFGDPTQIHQILMNLCTNAYHAMKETGGTLTVSLSVIELSATDYLDNLDLQSGKHVKLSVRDTGCGMSKELIEHIFDPFFTTKKQGEGTGLGLSVVHGIIKGHHGHITVYSEPGKGTEFHVYLPLLGDEHEYRQTDRNGHDFDLPKGSGTVLLVDDEQINTELLGKMLVKLGYSVILHTSGNAALSALQDDPAAIDLVFTDMSMPGMTGVEMIQEMRRLGIEKPTILCTGFSEVINEEKAKAMGIDGFLQKPFIMESLAVALRDVMEKQADKSPAVEE